MRIHRRGDLGESGFVVVALDSERVHEIRVHSPDPRKLQYRRPKFRSREVSFFSDVDRMIAAIENHPTLYGYGPNTQIVLDMLRSAQSEYHARLAQAEEHLSRKQERAVSNTASGSKPSKAK
jgi:hypothetical protein